MADSALQFRPPSLRSAVAFIFLLILVAAQPVAVTGSMYVGETISILRGPDADPLRFPTDVAVASNGTVFVADGTNDRIVGFAPDGRVALVYRAAEGLAFSRPVGVYVDSRDSLWVADTGNRRVVSMDAEGIARLVVPVSAGSGEWPPDVTDVLVTSAADGEVLWIVDNDNHRVLRREMASERIEVIGGMGEASGKFEYPFLAATGTGGEVYISDVINARVQILGPSGRPAGVLGSLGVDPGQLYRPKGLAVDRENNVWVADGVTGAVQVFAATGRFLDVLRDSEGNVSRFQAPAGLAFDASGQLYVVEQSAHCIRRVSIQKDEAALPAPGAARQGVASSQPRRCTACHLEWVEPLARGVSTPLMTPPQNPPSRPHASRSEMCFSCHDGSVADSRRSVWMEHGHRTGIRPPAGMSVARDLPLADGEITCRTCHSAHTRGGAAQTIRDAVFLRVEREPVELCVKCHSDVTGSLSDGMHPTHSPAVAVPAELLQARHTHEKTAATLDCLTCHQAHGAGANALLIPAAQPDRLCLSCHETIGDMPQGAAHHPVRAMLSEVQRSAVKGNLPGSPESEGLTCSTCHRVHQGADGRKLLRRSVSDSGLCLTCHGDYESLSGSAHDLRITAPREMNLRGETVADSGPCGACHQVHGDARNPAIAPGDAAGRCTSCHQAGQCAESKSGLVLNHPFHAIRGKGPGVSGSEADVQCTACHNPHNNALGHFLRSEPDALCLSCHSEQRGVLASAHAFASPWDIRNAAGRSNRETGSCGFCHSVHDAASLVPWTGNESSRNAPRGETCLHCHADGGVLAAAPALPVVHPLVGADGHRREPGDVGSACHACHDPHRADAGTAMLKSSSSADRRDVCFSCHGEHQTIDHSLHCRGCLPLHDPAGSACNPCHAAHVPSPVVPAGTWIAPLGSAADGAARYCTGCHRAGGPAPAVAFHRHPPIAGLVLLPADRAGVLPLVNEKGEPDPRGEVSCQTCHLAHGRSAGGGFDPVDVRFEDYAVLRAARPMLRPYTVPNLCSSCHGVEGLFRFLYYHGRGEPDRGPIDQKASR